jgi:hypothetical protein
VPFGVVNPGRVVDKNALAIAEVEPEMRGQCYDFQFTFLNKSMQNLDYSIKKLFFSPKNSDNMMNPRFKQKIPESLNFFNGIANFSV